MLPYIVVVEPLYTIAAEIVNEAGHLIAAYHLADRERTTAKVALNNRTRSIDPIINTRTAH
jgi:hypothetical protein